MNPVHVAPAASTSTATAHLPATADIPVLRVVAAVLRDARGRVLVAQRPPGKPQAGFWEFPGGKMHPGESELQCLARELHEELGVEIDADQALPLLNLEHAYPGRIVQLRVWMVGRYSGDAWSREGQSLRWLWPAELASVELLPADAPIVACLLRSG